MSLKKILLQPILLAHHDPDKLLVISCDACPYRVEAILAQENSSWREAPIALASSMLGLAKRNYAHVNREGLGGFWVHTISTGSSRVVMSPSTPITSRSLEFRAPLSRFPSYCHPVCRVVEYDFTRTITTSYGAGITHQKGDALSRLPPEEIREPSTPGGKLSFDYFQRELLTVSTIAKMTSKNPVLLLPYSVKEAGTL